MGLNYWHIFLNGDDTAFSKLYQFHFNEMLAYGLKLGFDKKIIEDAIQEVFIKIFTSKHKLQHIQNIEFYLLISLRNKLYDIYNQENRVQKVNYSDVIIENDDSIIESIINTEKETLIANQIKNSLKCISHKQRKIIHYHYKLDLSFDEISMILNITPEAVRKSLSRALKKMKSESNTKFNLSVLLTILG